MFFPAYHVGKRTNESCRCFVKKFEVCIEEPTINNKLEIYSDGNFEYEIILPETFGIDKINYGQLIKIKNGGRLIRKEKRIIFGSPKIEDIETTYVESHNSVFRGKLSRLVRKTKGFSKSEKQLYNHIAFFQFFWNYVNPLHKKQSPAMEEGMCDKLWAWRSFLHWKLTFVN